MVKIAQCLAHVHVQQWMHFLILDNFISGSGQTWCKCLVREWRGKFFSKRLFILHVQYLIFGYCLVHLICCIGCLQSDYAFHFSVCGCSKLHRIVSDSSSSFCWLVVVTINQILLYGKWRLCEYLHLWMPYQVLLWVNENCWHLAILKVLKDFVFRTCKGSNDGHFVWC